MVYCIIEFEQQTLVLGEEFGCSLRTKQGNGKLQHTADQASPTPT